MDKEVAMAVMDQEEYLDKANILLVQPAYKRIDRGPTNKLKAKLISILKKLKGNQDYRITSIKSCIPWDALLLGFMGYQRTNKLTPPQAYCI